MPVVEEDSIAFRAAALGVDGTWRREGGAAGTRETLLIQDGGSVEWHCVMPRARVTLEHGGRVVTGLGYVEELRLTLPPWTLPIEELRWGRFVGDGGSVVWVDWRGAHNKCLVIRNGARVTGHVTDAGVDMADDEAALKLEEGQPLREGTLGNTAIAAMAELHHLLPARILGVKQRMVVAPAVLEQPFMTPVKGWSISDVLKWP
jgi:hypothetical protein